MKIKAHKKKKEHLPKCVMCKKDAHSLEDISIAGNDVQICSQCKTKLVVR